jgi:hypothetical protein
MSAVKDNLLASVSADGDVRQLFRVLPVENDNLFSSVDLPSLITAINSLPDQVQRQTQEIPRSTLFGEFSDALQAPLSPVSSILSLSDEVTQHTIPDDDDLWQIADSQAPTSKKVVSWETFGVNRSQSPSNKNPFLTEQNPEIFDQQLRKHMNHIYSPNESGIVIDEGVFREASALLVLYLIIVSPFCLNWPRILPVSLERQIRPFRSLCPKITCIRHLFGRCILVLHNLEYADSGSSQKCVGVGPSFVDFRMSRIICFVLPVNTVQLQYRLPVQSPLQSTSGNLRSKIPILRQCRAY